MIKECLNSKTSYWEIQIKKTATQDVFFIHLDSKNLRK